MAPMIELKYDEMRDSFYIDCGTLDNARRVLNPLLYASEKLREKMAKLSDLKSYAERMNVKLSDELQVTLTLEERNFLIAKIDEELARNKAVLQRKCSPNIKRKTRERFQREWVILNELKAKL